QTSPQASPAAAEPAEAAPVGQEAPPEPQPGEEPTVSSAEILAPEPEPDAVELDPVTSTVPETELDRANPAPLETKELEVSPKKAPDHIPAKPESPAPEPVEEKKPAPHQAQPLSAQKKKSR
nr:hypothetical protein [Anaerolineae bacterium]